MQADNKINEYWSDGPSGAVPPTPGADDDGERIIISSFEEHREAVAKVAAVAKRSLAIYTVDLEPGVYDKPGFLEIAKRLVLAKRYSRIRVLIANPYRAIRNGNQFVMIARRLNSVIEIRNVHEDYRDHNEAYLVADDSAVVYRADAGKWQGIADTRAPSKARRYLATFDEIWEASAVDPELRELRV